VVVYQRTEDRSQRTEKLIADCGFRIAEFRGEEKQTESGGSDFDSAEPFDPELTTEGLTAGGLVAGQSQ